MESTDRGSAEPAGSAESPDGGRDERATIGRRGLVGVVVGAAAAGVVGVQVLRDDDRDRDADVDDTTAAPPAPAEPDEPAAAVVAAARSSTVEHRHGGLDVGDPLGRLHDLRTATEVVDDFDHLDPAGVPVGWDLEQAGPGAAAIRPARQEGGIVRLSTGSAATGRVGLRLGAEAASGGAPPCTVEWRLSVAPLAPGGAGGLVIGYVSTVRGGGRLPDAGVFFVRRTDLGDTWLCACAGAGGRTLVDTGVPVDPRKHRLQFSCDGSGTVRFAIDDVHVAVVTTDLPTDDDRYALGVELSSSAGSEPLTADLDWVYARRELVR